MNDSEIQKAFDEMTNYGGKVYDAARSRLYNEINKLKAENSKLKTDNEARKLDGELLVRLVEVVRGIAEKAVEKDYEFINLWAHGPFMMGLNHKNALNNPLKTCDNCGKHFTDGAFQVLDENHNVQEGLVQCASCAFNPTDEKTQEPPPNQPHLGS